MVTLKFKLSHNNFDIEHEPKIQIQNGSKQ